MIHPQTLAVMLLVPLAGFLVYSLAFAIVRTAKFIAFHENRTDRENAFSKHLDAIYRRANFLPKCSPGNCYCRRTCQHMVAPISADEIPY